MMLRARRSVLLTTQTKQISCLDAQKQSCGPSVQDNRRCLHEPRWFANLSNPSQKHSQISKEFGDSASSFVFFCAEQLVLAVELRNYRLQYSTFNNNIVILMFCVVV